MYSSARKLTAISFILAALSILGLVMVTMFFIYLHLAFHWMFALLLYLISITLIGLLLTISLRSILQDMDVEYENQARQINKLKERIEDLELKVK